MSEDTGYTLTIYCDDASKQFPLKTDYLVAEIEETISEWVDGGDWVNEDGDGCEVAVVWEVHDKDDNQIDCGDYMVQVPDDEIAKVRIAGGNWRCDHDWEWDESVGCRENPGVMGIGGTAISVTEICEHCGIVRNTRLNGGQRNPGQPKVQVRFEVVR